MPILMTLRMRLPVWPFQAPLRTRSQKSAILSSTSVDRRDHVFAINDDGSAFGSAESHVQHGALFRDVDLLTPEHGVDALAQAGFLRQLQEELEGFIRDAILRIIQIEANGLCGHALAALGVIRKELSEMEVADIFMMRLQGPSMLYVQ